GAARARAVLRCGREHPAPPRRSSRGATLMLRIEGLCVGFRRYRGLLQREEVTRLADVGFAIASGEVVAVVGNSGAGKSLLAHAILGLLPPNAVVRGRLIFEGQALDPPTLAVLRGRRIALLPQQVSH